MLGPLSLNMWAWVVPQVMLAYSPQATSTYFVLSWYIHTYTCRLQLKIRYHKFSQVDGGVPADTSSYMVLQQRSHTSESRKGRPAQSGRMTTIVEATGCFSVYLPQKYQLCGTEIMISMISTTILDATSTNDLVQNRRGKLTAFHSM